MRSDLAAATRSPTEDTVRDTAAPRYAFLNDQDAAFLRAVADRLIPADGYPSTSHACNTCHTIPGERAPAAHVGPPLTGFARRTNIGGSLPNRPETPVRFIMNAPRELPGTGMPDLQVSEPEARDIAALLYTLR